MERFFSFFRPRWFFLKGFTKEFSALKSRVFYPNCTIFSGATLLAFLYFLRFFSFVFCNGLLYIWIFENFIFLCFYLTYKNGVEPGKLSIFYRKTYTNGTGPAPGSGGGWVPGILGGFSIPWPGLAPHPCVPVLSSIVRSISLSEWEPIKQCFLR